MSRSSRTRSAGPATAKTVVLLPGDAPMWIENHARHMAERLSELGRVLIVFSKGVSIERVLPGEVGKGSVLGNSADGYPLWTGGLAAAIGLRRRHDAMVVVVWDRSSMLLALGAAVIARLRGERLVLDLEYPPGHTTTGGAAVVERILARLSASIVRLDPGQPDNDAERVVLAVCGGDIDFARTVQTAFTGLADAAVTDWRMKLLVEPGSLPLASTDDRHADRVSVQAGSPDAALHADVALVMVPHGAEFAHVVERAVARGSAGVIVGHPVAGRVTRRGDGVWLAADDPSAILVAMESSTGASHEPSPVSPAHLRVTGNAVVAHVARLAEPHTSVA